MCIETVRGLGSGRERERSRGGVRLGNGKRDSSCVKWDPYTISGSLNFKAHVVLALRYHLRWWHKSFYHHLESNCFNTLHKPNRPCSLERAPWTSSMVYITVKINYVQHCRFTSWQTYCIGTTRIIGYEVHISNDVIHLASLEKVCLNKKQLDDLQGNFGQMSVNTILFSLLHDIPIFNKYFNPLWRYRVIFEQGNYIYF